MFGGGNRNQQKKGADVKMDLPVSLKDLYLGENLEFESSKQVVCDKCRGSGAKSAKHVKTCTACKGAGHTIVHHQLGPGTCFVFTHLVYFVLTSFQGLFSRCSNIAVAATARANKSRPTAVRARVRRLSMAQTTLLW